MSFTSLPNELIYLIAKMLPASDLNSLLRSNRRIHSITTPLLRTLLDNEMEIRYIRALQKNNEKALISLIRNGADLNCHWETGLSTLENPHYATALRVAVQGGGRQVVAVLLESGASRCEHGQSHSLVTLAVQKNNYLLAKLLLENGFSPNSIDEHVEGPLFVAVHKCNPDMAALLLYFGADSKVKNARGKSPRDIAYGWRTIALAREKKRQEREEQGEELDDDDNVVLWGGSFEWADYEIGYERREAKLGNSLPVDLEEYPSILRLLGIAMEHSGKHELHVYLEHRMLEVVEFLKSWEAVYGTRTHEVESDSDY